MLWEKYLHFGNQIKAQFLGDQAYQYVSLWLMDMKFCISPPCTSPDELGPVSHAHL